MTAAAAARHRRGIIPFLRWLLVPDVEHHGRLIGGDRALFSIARSLWFASMVFSGWGWGSEILGRLIADSIGWAGYAVGGMIGFPFGVAISWWTAHGSKYTVTAFRDGHGWLGVGCLLSQILAAAGVFIAMSLLFSSFIDSSWDKLAEAERQDGNDRGSVERTLAQRDSLETQLASAEAVLASALSERSFWVDGRTIAMACPEPPEVCEAVKDYQRAAGVPGDGLVLGAGECATCGQTLGAIAAKLGEADAAIVAATSSRDGVSAQLEEIRRFDVNESAGRLNDANRAAEVRTAAKFFRSTVMLWITVRGWLFWLPPDPLFEAQQPGEDESAYLTRYEAAQAEIDRRAKEAGAGLALMGAFGLDVFSFVLNGVLAWRIAIALAAMTSPPPAAPLQIEARPYPLSPAPAGAGAPAYPLGHFGSVPPAAAAPPAPSHGGGGPMTRPGPDQARLGAQSTVDRVLETARRLKPG